jgi:hypothetical protein
MQVQIDANTNYLIKMRRSYDFIERYLDNIINEYDDLIKLSNDNQVNATELQLFLNEYNKKKQGVLLMKEQINNTLMECCDHKFVTDTVDSGLDTSYSVEYCIKCECFTK